ncbi:thioredoxin family protein [Tautonia marina]|uniref:thioredoxin family protein n=1 Tax=Tautonia marina TaxID=2653855 RepID=UPI0012605168|nr:thioredoxin family protein [Tautonia marina]
MRIARRFRPSTVGGLILALLMVSVSATASASADDPKPTRNDSPAPLQPREVAFTAAVEPPQVRPGETVTYAITAKLDDSWHLYAHAEEIPEGVAVLPTRFELFSLGGLEPDDRGWTPSQPPKASDPNSDLLSFSYHEGTVTWKRTLRVPDDARPGAVDLKTQVFFQLCDDSVCKPPTRRTVPTATLTILDPNTQARIDRPASSLLGLFGPLLIAPQDDPQPERRDSPAPLQPKEAAFTTAVEPVEARPGEVVNYQVKVTLAPTWHIYAISDTIPEGVAAVPTRFDLFGLSGLEPAGDWTSDREAHVPEEVSGVLAYDYFEDEVTWTLPLRVPADAAPGERTLRTQIQFQLCDPKSCKPPTRLTLPPVTLTVLEGDGSTPSPAPESNPAEPASSAAPAAEPTTSASAAQDDAQPERRDSPPVLQPKEAQFKTTIEPVEARPGEIVNYQVAVTLDPTWHIYAISDTIPEGVAAVPTRFDLFGLSGLEPAGDWTSDREAHVPEEVSGVLAYDYFEDEVTWTLPLRVPADAAPGERTLRTQIQFQLCDPKSCKPPTRLTLPSVTLTVLEGDGSTPAPTLASTPSTASPTASDASAETTAEPIASSPGVATGELAEKLDQGLLSFMAWSALGGLVALLMPCVWPMVPITVNFFVKQGQMRKDRSTTGLAVTYCVAIIGVFTLVGVLFSAFFGAASLSQLANAAWLNLLVAGLFIAFGLSLLGVFEIRLPNFLLNASAQGEARGGMVGVMFMALTLTITSFTCTFPVVGALLVLAAGGSYLYPVIGLATFATVLALPFFLLALAPGLLQSMPKSGDWMNAVKVVGGLIEIGAAFKFLNTAEISLGANPENAWLDAQVLLATWVIIAVVCGLYLLGMFKTNHDHGEVQVGAGRILFGTLFLGLGLYFSPALFGYPPKSKIYDRVVVGLLPADADEMDILLQMQKRGMTGGGGGGASPGGMLVDENETDPVRRARNFHGVWWGMSYEAALEQAKATGKPVLIDFTGVNCANCRLMEKSVIPRPEVVQRLEQFVPVQLYTDRVPVEELTPDEKFDLAEQNLMLEVELTNQQVSPLYVILTPDEQLVLTPRGGYIEPDDFVAYLDRGLAEFSNLAKTASASE